MPSILKWSLLLVTLSSLSGCGSSSNDDSRVVPLASSSSVGSAVSSDESSASSEISFSSDINASSSVDASSSSLEGFSSSTVDASSSSMESSSGSEMSSSASVVSSSSSNSVVSSFSSVEASSSSSEEFSSSSQETSSSSSVISISGSGKLNDTGIDWCANTNTSYLPCPVPGFGGQDGEHGRDAQARAGTLSKVGAGAAGFDYTKLGADGNTLPAIASEWSCVRDNHTGLIWEVKTNDGGLRDMNNTYTWYNPDDTRNGGHPGTQNGGSCNGSTCDTHSFVQAVNAEGLCGAGDWRLPSRNELRSLMHRGRQEPAIDTVYFPHTPKWSWYWSSSLYADYRFAAWRMSFGYGGADIGNKNQDNQVRLVHAGK